jgi:serine protease AprX
MTKRVCTICFQVFSSRELHRIGELEDHVQYTICLNLPRWNRDNFVCRDCVTRLITAHEELGLSMPKDNINELRILPTPVRLGASSRFTGRGVTIAFLDSGFFWHPDLTQHNVRILRYVNILSPRSSFKELRKPDVSSWHGMMTSVVAAGNGYLSNGVYRGIASDARLVLLKVGYAQRILHEDITRGLEWVIRNHKKYNIRIVNISCGGDYEASYLHDRLSQTAEEAVRAGLIVLAASGNAGHNSHNAVLPPASAPSVITVGGLDDKNDLNPATDDMYHSSYGPTIDGLQKPEVLAPGIWIAAPILPGTPTADQAMLLDKLERTPDHALRDVIAEHHGIDPDLDAAKSLDFYLIRHLVGIKVRNNNVISSHYKHVDGTSFAAPIVSSIVAQMLEANPYLTPQEVKQILIKTAVRLPHVAVDRQGWGIVNPRSAVARALELRLSPKEAGEQVAAD